MASKAGVSRPCVYHILAEPDHPRYPPDTRKRVLKAAKTLNYVPNVAGRVLRTRRSHTIAMFVDEQALTVERSGGYFADFVPGVCSEAIRRGYHLLLETRRQGEVNGEVNVTRELTGSGRVDGIILSHSEDNPLFAPFRSVPFPVVVPGDTNASKYTVDTVVSDLSGIIRMATQHLLDLGHRQIVHLTGPTTDVGFNYRRQGYEKAMSQAETKNITAYDKDFANIRLTNEIVDELWSSPNPPTGIVVDDDILAIGIVQALQKRGLNVPEDVSVVGVNDSMVCKRITPALTSINLNARQIGEEMARLLITRIENPAQPPRRVVVPFELVVRESTARQVTGNRGRQQRTTNDERH